MSKGDEEIEEVHAVCVFISAREGVYSGGWGWGCGRALADKKKEKQATWWRPPPRSSQILRDGDSILSLYMYF